MQMHLIIASFFILTVIIAFIEERINTVYKIAILCAYVLFMVFLASTKDIETTADAVGYEEKFLTNDELLTELTTEPTFIYLSRLLIAIGGTISTLFFVYAVVTIPLKMKALFSLTPYVFTALVLYIPKYFELHDMIQIRAAAAVTFFFLAIKPICDKRYIVASLLVLCAILMHYSAACLIPFIFWGNRKLSYWGRIIAACLIPLSFALYFLKMDLFSLIPSFLVGGKLDFYKESTEKGEWQEISAPYLNLYFMGKCFVAYLCLYYYDFLIKIDKKAPLLINLFITSIVFLLSMSTIPVIGGRISDMFGIIDCLVFTYCLYIFSPKYIVRIALAIIGLFVIVYNMVNTEYFL